MTAPLPGQSIVPPRRRWLRRLALLIAASGALFLFWLVAVWPPPLWYRWVWPRTTAFMELRARQADSLARHPERRRDAVAGELPRIYRPVPLARIAQTMQTAALVAEDHRFFEHGGIDFQAIREALGYRRDDFDWSDRRDREELTRVLGRAWERRERVRGASTITQQLAKNLYLSPSRNPLRKLKEAVTAYRLEWAIPKPRLLELYLNVVEFGPEIWGVEAASRTYFGRSADRLSAEQAAALAASLPYPLRTNPGYRPGRMRWRQDLILRRMRGEQFRIPADSEAVEEPPPSDSTILPP
jgi:monofunctional biosynthetic peptidoglycan transglycosylase